MIIFMQKKCVSPRRSPITPLSRVLAINLHAPPVLDIHLIPTVPSSILLAASVELIIFFLLGFPPILPILPILPDLQVLLFLLLLRRRALCRQRPVTRTESCDLHRRHLSKSVQILDCSDPTRWGYVALVFLVR